MSSRTIRTVVQPDGRIEVHAPDLPPGAAVEVVIRSPDGKARSRSAKDILAEAPGHRLFRTDAEVDAHLHDERTSWDR